MTVRIAETCLARSPCERRRSPPTGEPGLNGSALAPLGLQRVTAGVMPSPADFRAGGRDCAVASRAEAPIAAAVEIARTKLDYQEFGCRAKRRNKGCRRYSLRLQC